MIKKMLPILLLGATISTDSSAANKPKVNNKFTEEKVSKRQQWIYDISDFFLSESIGYTDVLPETEEYVRTIQKKMKMEHITIRIRKMSKSAMSALGRENACALAVPYANTIYLSEEWLKNLSEQEKQFIIGHELAHLKNKHVYKNDAILSLALLTQLSLILLPLYIRKEPSRIYQITTSLISLCGLAGCCACIRYHESEADAVSAEELDNIQGGIDLFERFENEKDPESRFRIKRALNKMLKIIFYPFKIFASHPSHKARIENLKKLAEEVSHKNTGAPNEPIPTY